MKIIPVLNETSTKEIRMLFREYETALGADLSFQNFEDELAAIPENYVPPHGSLLLAIAEEKAAGCVAMRKKDEYSCEMKRLFVRPSFRSRGIGRLLAQEVIRCSRQVGYRKMYLDTLISLEGAIALYKSLGFKETEPYYHNPMDGVIYMQLDLAK